MGLTVSEVLISQFHIHHWKSNCIIHEDMNRYLSFFLFLLLNGIIWSCWAQDRGQCTAKEVSVKGKHLSFRAAFSGTTEDVSVFLKDGLLLYKNTKEPLRVFSIHQLNVVADLGSWGEYSSLFFLPYFSQSSQDSLLCYVSDQGIVYRLAKDGEAVKTNQRIYSWGYENGGNRVVLVHDFAQLNDSTWLFAGKSINGFSIFKTVNSGKNAQTEELIPLNAISTNKGWEPFVGNFTLSPDKRRAIYAYQFFNAFAIINLQENTVNIIKKEGREFNSNTLKVPDGIALNTNHYSCCHAGEKYIYMLYIGRDYKQVNADNAKKKTYVYIERYDWNGVLIQRIRLDRFGKQFCIDEKNGKIILVSKTAKTSKVSPFYIYDLPH